MGLFSWFKSAKSAETIVDGFVNGADKLFYTEEEKAEARERAQGQWLDALKIDADASNIRSVTRRWIAIIAVAHYFLWIDAALIAYAWDAAEFAKFAFKIITDVFWLIFTIASFYFGPALAERAAAAMKRIK